LDFSEEFPTFAPNYHINDEKVTPYFRYSGTSAGVTSFSQCSPKL
jgi:hypothetical protein